MSRKFKRISDGEWVAPRRKGYKMMCCDCNLVHNLDFKLIKHARGKRIIFRAWRNEASTALARRRKPT